jgi:hypothetical protein
MGLAEGDESSITRVSNKSDILQSDRKEEIARKNPTRGSSERENELN